MRRALNDDEIDRLIRASGKRTVVYFLAAYTGLRRAEIQQLTWGDIHLDVPKPFVEVRASTTKNKKSAVLPLVPALAEMLARHKEKEGRTEGRVFRVGVPTAKTLRSDLAAVGIQAEDELGRRVDFHALRHTFGTALSRAGVTPRTAMELMRHSDIPLTRKTYTDVNSLPLFAEMDKLKPTAPSALPSSIASPKSARKGQNVGEAVQNPKPKNGAQSPVVAVVVQDCPTEKLAEMVGFEPLACQTTKSFAERALSCLCFS